jgi:N-acetylmuramoyl-L-alanine amidase
MLKTIIITLLIVASATIQARSLEEINCLAKNIYHEARGEIWQGQLAVALVTINRTQSRLFPNTICKVVYQPGQFTWTSMPQLRVLDYTAWQNSLWIANLALDIAEDFASTFPALYFHNKTVKPLWHHRRIAVIGNHVFYR